MTVVFWWLERLVWILALIVAGTLIAGAEEQPCRRSVVDGKPSVVCDTGGFDVLVKRLIDADAAAKTCAVKLDACTGELSEVRGALDSCLSRPVPVPPAPPKPRSIWPVALAAVGGALLGVSVTSDWSAGGRATGAVVGFTAVAVGIVGLDF